LELALLCVQRIERARGAAPFTQRLVALAHLMKEAI
jgi:hypothetical protein